MFLIFFSFFVLNGFCISYLLFCFTENTYLNHQTIVEVDLKKFNVPAEFGLKTSTEVRNSKFDHSANLYLHSSKDKSQYAYQIYAHPKESGRIALLITLINEQQ